MKCIPKITLVTNFNAACQMRQNNQTKYLDQYLKFIKYWINKGINCVQLREKNLQFNEMLEFGLKIKWLLDKYKIPLIINDSLDVCLALNASGVHLGQSDGNILQARVRLGDNKILGYSTNTLDQVIKANFLPIDYIGVGAIFSTKSKLDIENIWGLENLGIAVKKSIHPIIAIGGINFNNAHKTLEYGAKGFAGIELFTEFFQNNLCT